MSRYAIVIAGLFGVVGVIAGAFGAHMLKDRLTESQLNMWNTAVEYQIYHSLALLLVGLRLTLSPCRTWGAAGWSFCVGMLLFSGGLFTYVFVAQGFLMALVPLGGTAFIVGWGLIAVGGWRDAAAAKEEQPQAGRPM